MKPNCSWSRLRRWAVALPVCSITLASVCACTIFVITDSQHVLFCNNEDWSNPKTRIWFIPGDGHYGRVYVGFDNGWGQGGLNTEGLAFDWVAGFKEKWEPNPKLKHLRGHAWERMLETCATVEEAITFFQAHWEPSFSYAKILIADRSGASVILGAKDGNLTVERLDRSRAFGYRGHLAESMLAQNPEPTLPNAATILRAAIQEGQYATKYSNVFDLKTGDIYLYRFPDQGEAVKLNLAEELKKGGHFYDIPKVKDQMGQKPKPLSQLKGK
jgi:hypothetical protein